jgi:hypothetical protein
LFLGCYGQLRTIDLPLAPLQFREARESNAGQSTSRADLKAAEDAEQKKLAPPWNPFYKSLDAGQQQSFAAKFDVNGEGRHFWFKRQRNS